MDKFKRFAWELVKAKSENYVVHSPETNSFRQPNATLKAHVLRISLKELSERKNNLIGIIDEVIENYHEFCKKHGEKPRLKPHEKLVEPAQETLKA